MQPENSEAAEALDMCAQNSSKTPANIPVDMG